MPLKTNLQQEDIMKFSYLAPPEASLPIPLTVEGCLNKKQLTIPQLFAREFDQRSGYVLSVGNPYMMWADPFNEELGKLGFFNDPEIYRLPSEYDRPRGKYSKYSITHYILRFYRTQEQKQQMIDLQDWLKPYYEHFEESPGKENLEQYWPSKMNIKNYKHPKPSLSAKSKAITLKITVPHITASVLLHALPYVKDKTKQEEIEKALKFAMELSKCFVYEKVNPPISNVELEEPDDNSKFW